MKLVRAACWRLIEAGLVLCCALAAPRATVGQQAGAAAEAAETSDSQDQPADVAKQSLPLRTALHHDATLDVPFDRLVAMYRVANRLAELVEIYRQHTTNYPADPNGAAVFVRLLAASGDSQALATAEAMAEKHATVGYLQFLKYQALDRAKRPGALEALEKAIELAPSPRHKAAWIEILLKAAASSEQPQLIDKYLQQMAAQAGTPGEQLEVAERMAAFARHKAALELLEKAVAANPSPELAVKIEMAAASAEVAANEPAAAAARLERLLAKLAPDYWGRAEIMRRRIALVTSETERSSLVDAAVERVARQPGDETAVLDLAQLLVAFERRREALTVLLQAAGKFPAAQRLEKLTLELLDRLRDEPARQAYLAERLKKFPERTDLLAMRFQSLLMTGQRAEAREARDKLLKLLPPKQQLEQELELARALRRANLAGDAAELLERVVESAPARFDLRRELAELYVKLGNRSRARELFSGQLPDDVSVENVVDFVPFLVQQEMFVEARRALLKSIKPDEPNLDLRLLLADVERRTGNRATADQVLIEARPLADTAARYKLWIEAEAALHDEDESLPAFVADEKLRLTLDSPAAGDGRVERILALLEAAGRNRRINLIDLADGWLNDPQITPAAATRIRQQLVRALDKATGLAGELAGQLQDLIDAHPDDADEYRARLALLHMRSNSFHLVQPLLAEVRVGRLSDVALLGELEKAYAQLNQPHQVLAVLERLTTLDPANKSTWQAWLYRLAAAGQEERLRDALRRLLAGVDGLKLDDPVRQLLQAQLIDSYGRSILQNIMDSRAALLSDVLTMLAAAERLTTTPQQSLWLYWNRAFILNRLGRTQQRDEAIYEMERIYADMTSRRPAIGKPPAASGSAVTPEEAASDAGDDAIAAASFRLDEEKLPKLRFPDGLTLSMATARRLLTEPPQPLILPAVAARTGPMPKLRTVWAFDLPADRPIERLLAASSKRIFLVDATGTIWAVDARTGKALWQSPVEVPATGNTAALNVNFTFNPNSALMRTANLSCKPPLAPVIVDGDERIYFAHAGEVVCVSGGTGELLWRSTISNRQPGQQGMPTGRNPMQLFRHGADIVAYDPDVDAVGVLSPRSGKLLWSVELEEVNPLAEGRNLHWLNTGASLAGDRLFVYGRRTALVDLARAKVEWTIDPEQATRLPIKLDAATNTNANAPPPAPAASPFPQANMPFMMRRGRYFQTGPMYAQPPQPTPPTLFLDHTRPSPQVASGGRQDPNAALVGPAAIWSSASISGQPRAASLQGSRLLLSAQDRVTVMDVALPLSGNSTRLDATFLGCVGQLACFLGPNEFVQLNANKGVRGIFALNDISGGNLQARLEAVLDGPLAYVTGPRGILCLNTYAGRRVFSAPWPEGAALADDDPRAGNSPDAEGAGTQYLWNGIATPTPAGTRCTPPLIATWQGRLYATWSPWRLVAIEGATDK